ncbi:unnamed protein product [Polarella glacialis]|uniref:Pentatricopeptide repeat-containing protein, chloroplastic n=1 Tax=Polarella glacialis TaxID=89957 RepID=A0A813KX19_POLGL|nr:unnamed protein product [Polarella glacialis]CAE8714444.1 unnamed protein product [Polarella glacialis]
MAVTGQSQSCRADGRKELLDRLRKSTSPIGGLRAAQSLILLPGVQTKDLVVALSSLSRCHHWQGVLGILNNWQRRSSDNSFSVGKSEVLLPRLDTACFNTAGGAMVRASQWPHALNLLVTSKICFVEPDVLTLNMAISASHKGSFWVGALDLLHEATLQNLKLDTVSFNSAVSACSSAGFWQQSLGLVSRLLIQGCELSVVSLTAVATAVSTLSAICDEHHWMLSLDLLLRHMQLRGLRLDVTARNSALTAAEHSSEWPRVLTLLHSTRESGIEADRISRNQLTTACGRCSAWQQALVTLRWGTSACDGLEPDVIGLNAAMSACETGSQWVAAIQLLGLIQRPSVVSVNTAINACGIGQQWSSALSVLRRLLGCAISGLRADAISCAGAVAACQRALQWAQAGELLVAAPLWGIVSSASAHNSAAAAFVKSGRWQQALSALRRLMDIEGGTASFGSESDRAQSGLRADIRSFAAVAGACQQASCWEQSLAVLAALGSAGIRSGLLLQNAALGACRKSRKWRSSLELVGNLGASETMSNVVSLEAAVDACELGSKPQEAVRWLDEAVKTSIFERLHSEQVSGRREPRTS